MAQALQAPVVRICPLDHYILLLLCLDTCSDHHDSDSALSYHLVISVNISVPQSMHLTAQCSIFIALPCNYQHIKL